MTKGDCVKYVDNVETKSLLESDGWKEKKAKPKKAVKKD